MFYRDFVKNRINNVCRALRGVPDMLRTQEMINFVVIVVDANYNIRRSSLFEQSFLGLR